MKNLYLIFVLIPIIGLSQKKREVIDSIHSKRVCVEYPGLTYFPKISEEFKKSQYVFTGKVIEIIRREKLTATDYDQNGPIDFQPVHTYWYVFEINEQFKGKKKEKITVLSKMYSSISPLLILNKEYLVYALKAPKHYENSYPFIYCNGRTTIIEYANDDIKEIKRILKE